MLLTGDVELAAQADLLAAGVPLRADVLKMPHHGSRYTAPRFLPRSARGPCWSAWVRATATGTPTPALLDRLDAAGAVIRRTDQAGDVAVVPPARGRPTRHRADGGQPR